MSYNLVTLTVDQKYLWPHMAFFILFFLIGSSANFYLNNDFQWFWKRSGKFLPQLTLLQTMPQLYSLSLPKACWRRYYFFTYKPFFRIEA